MFGRRDIMPDEIVSFAEAVGRKQRTGSSPPVYVLKGRPPLPVHAHPRALKKMVAKKSLDILLGDLDMWEMQLSEGRMKPNGNA
jgi:hypothetical protein